MYLYCEKSKGLEPIPEALLELFGTPVHLMDMPLKEGKTLARADSAKVMSEIRTKGFYLQMPPPKEDYLLDLFPNRPETGVR